MAGIVAFVLSLVPFLGLGIGMLGSAFRLG